MFKMAFILEGRVWGLDLYGTCQWTMGIPILIFASRSRVVLGSGFGKWIACSKQLHVGSAYADLNNFMRAWKSLFVQVCNKNVPKFSISCYL